MLRRFFFILFFSCSLLPIQVASATTFYISPNGSDNNSGLTSKQPWKTFDHAWPSLFPGDTLILMDGVYFQTINPNERNGLPGQPITVRAENDGQAIIDGEAIRETVRLESWEKGPVGSYYVFEGIVARNSSGSVFQINFDHNIFRRVSGYNAYTDGNEHIFTISANHTLLEDCVAAGSGRKMIVVFQGSHNVIRRCFANWHSWDGRQWHDAWPWGDNIQIYNASDNIIENSIAYGPVPLWAISIQANGPEAVSSRNRILGSMAINAGMNANGTPKRWPDTRPGPSEYTTVRDFDWPSQRVGIMMLSIGVFEDNLIQDVVSWGNAGLGFSSLLSGASSRGNSISTTSIYNNGLDNPANWGGVGAEIIADEISKFSVANTFIEEHGDFSGGGALIEMRYIDGQLTTEPLWPWPMEERIESEMGLSVNSIAASVLESARVDITPTATLVIDPTATRGVSPSSTTQPESQITLTPTSTAIPPTTVPEPSDTPRAATPTNEYVEVQPTSTRVPLSTVTPDGGSANVPKPTINAPFPEVDNKHPQPLFLPYIAGCAGSILDDHYSLSGPIYWPE